MSSNSVSNDILDFFNTAAIAIQEALTICLKVDMVSQSTKLIRFAKG